MSIAIIDDDAAVLGSLCFLLETEGFDVLAFGRAPDLLHALGHVRPRCLIVDCKMPQMDGFELMDELRRRQDHTPVILITGHPGALIRRRAEEHGAPLIEKPLSQDRLLSEVRAAMA